MRATLAFLLCLLPWPALATPTIINYGPGGGAGACGAVVTIGGGVVGNWTNFNRP